MKTSAEKNMEQAFGRIIPEEEINRLADERQEQKTAWRREKVYTWEQINQALSNKGLGTKSIVRIMFELNAIHRNEK